MKDAREKAAEEENVERMVMAYKENKRKRKELWTPIDNQPNRSQEEEEGIKDTKDEDREDR